MGQTVAERYRVLRLIARGGMGRIYEAEQVGLGRRVALKVLDIVGGESESFRKRFSREAATCARLSHPNIVIVHDYGSFESEGQLRYYMAMEYIEGPTLGMVLKQEGPLPVGRAAFIAREIARALREAHHLGVVHRDLKPSNVMLVRRADGESVKVLDFGIAKVLREDGEGERDGEPLTREGVLVGTPRYMAPEQILGGDVDPRTDIYSLGVLFYQMLAGHTPFAGKDNLQAIIAHLNQPPPDLPEPVRSQVPPSVQAIIRTCLQKDPAQRFSSATEFLAALNEVAPEIPGWVGGITSGELSAVHSSATSLLGVEPPSNPSHPSHSGTRTLSEWARSTSSVSIRATPVSPASDDLKSKKKVLLAVGVLGAIGVGGLAWFAVGGRGGEKEGTPSLSLPQATGEAKGVNVANSHGQPSASTQANPVDSSTTSQPVKSFRLTIRTQPEGASVTSGGLFLGRTPLILEIRHDEVRDASKEFRIERPGYAPYILSQGPSNKDVEIDIPLIPLEAQERTTSRRRSGGARPAQPTLPQPQATAPPPPEELMLKTKR
ncbi:MAG: protein kinase [Sandaracinaceae bacterium]|nr:protein kinase [Sandaracinaceae bacterium]